ncbi:hypothetical protein C7S16_1283 [Burkholderia thailandensis]|uniref:Uncharacterized protein n=1 Tax=Burkholderia thailandensis TaxID=57975 RepID=A0AAW9D6R9_BURTH|nr:hypothetical protein [Burkholderia thailandensis]
MRAEQRERRMRRRNFTRLAAFFCETVARGARVPLDRPFGRVGLSASWRYHTGIPISRNERFGISAETVRAVRRRGHIPSGAGRARRIHVDALRARRA